MKNLCMVLLCVLLVGGTYSTASGQDNRDLTELSYNADVDVGAQAFQIKRYEMAPVVLVNVTTNWNAQALSAWPQSKLSAFSVFTEPRGYSRPEGHEPVGWRCSSTNHTYQHSSQASFNAVFQGRGTGGPGLIRY